MINITFKPKTLELEIQGHAGQGKKGEDIVCSAISTLFYTLGQALIDSEEMLEDKLTFKDEDGAGYLSCKPKEEYKGNIVRSYWTILEGFRLVAENYKKNVKLTIVG
jgi:uncharacterized protein YsxB (DUF464 family)